MLITEEGGEKLACYPLTGMGACTRKGNLMQEVKNTCPLPMGINLVLSCIVASA